MADKGPNASGGALPQQQMIEQPDLLTSTPIAPLSSTKILQSSQTSSAANSPKASRDTSPIRPAIRTSASARPGERSRKNSKEISPSRSASATTNNNPPSAAAIQRTLSATTTPQLQHSHVDVPVRAPVPQKPSEIKETLRWPISPRLKSPPLRDTSITSPRKTEYDSAAIKLQRSGSSTTSGEGGKKSESEEESPSTSGMRGQLRGVSASNSILETVQESSQPGTPAVGYYDGLQDIAEDGKLRKIREQENPIDSVSTAALKPKSASSVADSGNESAGKSEVKGMRSTTVPVTQPARPNVAPATKSYASGVPTGRGKALGEGSTRNMTVETETVNSIPQVAIGGGAGVNNGSLRTKPSSETIRPKKEKKRTTRKAPSNSGMASSKADIFEAKIANAVEEAASSDSEETFVYESNPPDAPDRPRPRFHSRTPSATSMVSQLNTRDGNRGLHALDGGHSVALKKSMKFTNSYNNNNSGNNEATGVDDDGKGTVRNNLGTGRGTVYHHHIGRFGRRDGNGHPSLFDQESPFPNASRPFKLSGNNSRHSSRPTSPRFSQHFKGKRSPMTNAYDPDDTAADDERTPLIHAPSIRSARPRGQRRMANMRHHDRQNSGDGHNILGRNSACWIFSIMMVLITLVAAGFVFATTEPLEEVHLIALQNIVASEQELMLDLVVSARNPNAVSVGVDSLDMSVFAVTRHASEESEDYYLTRGSFHDRRKKHNSLVTFDDSPYDPPFDEEDPAAETIRLGSILVFDSPLQFDGFPWQHEHSQSTGAVTLSDPGVDSNRTVEWERALKHDFDLVVKGVLKYTLPLSGRVRKASVEGRVTVKPGKAGKGKDKDEKNGTDDDGGPDGKVPVVDGDDESGVPFISGDDGRKSGMGREKEEKGVGMESGMVA